MEQNQHNNPDAQTPMEFNQSDIQSRKLTPEEIRQIKEYMRQNPEIRELFHNTLDGPKWLFIVVTVSMILGIILFCVGVLFYDSNEDLCGWLAGIGVTLFIAVPTLCTVIDKLRREKKDGKNADMWSFKRQGTDTPMTTDEDTNYEPHTPAAWIMIFGGLGVLLLIASLLFFPTVFSGQTAYLTGSTSAFFGCLLLTVALAADGRHDAALTWGIFTAAAAGILIPGLINAEHPFYYEDTLIEIILLSFSGVLMLSSLIFVLFRRLTCSEIVTASCIYQNKFYNPRGALVKYSYRHYWKYEWNGKYYIHKEFMLYRDEAGLEEIPVRINPQHPQMFYRRSVPFSCVFFSVAGGIQFLIVIIVLLLT